MVSSERRKQLIKPEVPLRLIYYWSHDYASWANSIFQPLQPLLQTLLSQPASHFILSHPTENVCVVTPFFHREYRNNEKDTFTCCRHQRCKLSYVCFLSVFSLFPICFLLFTVEEISFLFKKLLKLVGYAHGMWKLLGLGLNLHHSNDNANSLTHCATSELLSFLLLRSVLWFVCFALLQA